MKVSDLKYLSLDQLAELGSSIDYICEDTQIEYIKSKHKEVVDSLCISDIRGSTCYNRDDYEIGKENLLVYKKNLIFKRKLRKYEVSFYVENYKRKYSELLKELYRRYKNLSKEAIKELVKESITFKVVVGEYAFYIIATKTTSAYYTEKLPKEFLVSHIKRPNIYVSDLESISVSYNIKTFEWYVDMYYDSHSKIRINTIGCSAVPEIFIPPGLIKL